MDILMELEVFRCSIVEGIEEDVLSELPREAFECRHSELYLPLAGYLG